MKMSAMQARIFALVFLCGLCCSEVRQVSSVPPIAAFFNRITNTTFGILRGGLNIFSRSVDRITTTFGRVEDRLRGLLEEFRRIIIRGIPELSIPILDPLHIEKIEFNVLHEAANLNGSVEDVTVKHISKFVIDGEEFRDLGNLRFRLDLNLTFPHVTIDGIYNVDGIIGDSIPIFGDGKFWLNLIDFKLAISTVIEFNIPKLRLSYLSIHIQLGALTNYFDNLMHDDEIGDLFNKAVSKLAPEAIDMLWPDIKKPVQEQIKKYVNDILENATVANLARRLFNIR